MKITQTLELFQKILAILCQKSYNVNQSNKKSELLNQFDQECWRIPV